MEQLSLLQKIYQYGETLSSNELNQIVQYLNSSIEAINKLIAKNNSINEGHCEMRFKVSTQQPNAPAKGSDGTSDGWSDTYTMPDTANGECSWMTLSFFNGEGVYGSWSTPVCITWGSIPGQRGPKGESGIRGPFKSRVFKRQNSKPATPTGGNYDNPFPTSGGWTDGIPSGQAIIWSSVCTFYGNGSSSGWSEPAAESDTDTLDIEFSPSSIQPDPPIGSTPFANHESEGWYDPSSANFINVGVMIWRAERKVSNGVYNGNWTITRIFGEKGAKGDSGDNGGHYKFRYCNFTPTPGHTTPTKPTQGSDGVGTFGSGADAATWAISVSDPNVNAGEYTYMTSCYVNSDNEYGTWDDPIRITGGEGMTGEDGSDIEFIYTINNTGDIPDAPTASGSDNTRIFTEDDWYGEDENGIIWTDNPTGISLENQYEYVAIREKPAGRDSSWSSYKVALWSKWGEKGQDGDGFEYIFLLSQEGDPSKIANPTPQDWSNLSSDYQTMHEYAVYLEQHIPAGEQYWWTDEPQSITSIYPYVYVSKRTKKQNGQGANAIIPGVEATKMVWGQFSAPSLWCRYASQGSTGAHYEFRYCNFKPHSGQTKPTTPTTGSNGRGYFGSDSDTYGGYWGDSAADPDVENKEYTYMTQCIFTPVEDGNDYYGEWSEPVRITGAGGEPGADGTDIEFIYCQYGPNAWSNPVAPTVSDDATIAMDDWPNVDGHTPSKTINGITWYDNPQGVDASDHKYEYMCQRIKPKGSQSWEPYNGPVIWSAYGDKGQDGDGFEYIYYLQDSLTPPDNPTPQDWYENTNYQNNNEYAGFLQDWTDDPQSVSQNNRYLFVCKRQKTYNSTYNKVMWNQFSSPSLWARYAEQGETGGHYEFRYCNFTPSTNHETPTKPSDNSNGIGTYGTGVDASTWARAVQDPDINNGEYTYMSQCYITPGTPNDTYGTWTDPVRITGADGYQGADGSDIEFIYTINNTGDIPDAPTASHSSNSKVFTEDDWYGRDSNGVEWTDSPSGVTSYEKYEYVAVREKPAGKNQSWGAYHVALWSKWGENGMDGDGVEYIFKRFTEAQSWEDNDDNPAHWGISQSREYRGPSGHQWTDDPTGVDDTYLYEYVSIRYYRNEQWRAYSTPALWAKYGQQGIPGPTGPNGRYYIKQYKKHNSRLSVDDSGWSDTAPELNENDNNPYIWERSRLYNPNTDQFEGNWSYVCLTGKEGNTSTITGPAGPMYYPAGKYQDGHEYTVTDKLVPVVLYKPTGGSYNYYYAKQTTSVAPTTGDASDSNWGAFENFEVMFTDVLFASQAHLGAFIINGNYFMSQQGTDSNDREIYYYEDNFNPYLKMNAETGRLWARKGFIGGFEIGDTYLGDTNALDNVGTYISTTGNVWLTSNSDWGALRVIGGGTIEGTGSDNKAVNLKNNYGPVNIGGNTVNIGGSNTSVVNINGSAANFGSSTPVSVGSSLTVQGPFVLGSDTTFITNNSSRAKTVALPSNPSRGQMVFAKGTVSDLTLTGAIRDDEGNTVTSVGGDKKSRIFIYGDSYWNEFYSS